MTVRDFESDLQLIANPSRRELLKQLRHAPSKQMQVNSIVDILAQAAQSMETEPVDRKRIAIRLFHVHLPKLMAHGIVEYDSDDGTVRYRPGDSIEEVLDALSAPISKSTVNSGR